LATLDTGDEDDDNDDDDEGEDDKELAPFFLVTFLSLPSSLLLPSFRIIFDPSSEPTFSESLFSGKNFSSDDDDDDDDGDDEDGNEDPMDCVVLYRRVGIFGD